MAILVITLMVYAAISYARYLIKKWVATLPERHHPID